MPGSTGLPFVTAFFGLRKRYKGYSVKEGNRTKIFLGV